jgi:hypothetical protein
MVDGRWQHECRDMCEENFGFHHWEVEFVEHNRVWKAQKIKDKSRFNL